MPIRKSHFAVVRGRLIFLLVLAGLIVGLILAVTLVNRQLTAYVEAEAFRKELDKGLAERCS